MDRIPASTRVLRPLIRIIAPTVVVTLGVTALAWAAVNGGGIVDGSITGRDIRSNSVPGLDVTNGTIARADLAPAERSEVIERIRTTPQAINGTGAVVLSQQVPKGSWKVSGFAEVTNADGVVLNSTCDLRRAPIGVFAMRSYQLVAGEMQLHAMETTITLGAATTLQLLCSSSGNIVITNGQIIAERVGKVTKTGSWPIVT